MPLRRRPVLTDLTAVTAGATIANGAGYLLHVLAGRWLGVAGYGEFASLLAIQVVCAVPALALQNVVAREVVRGASVAAVRRLGWRCMAVVGIIAALALPAVSALCQAPPAAAAAAVIVAPVQVLLSAEQGILQGQRRFRVLALVLGAAAVARVGPALVGLAVGVGGPASLWLAAAGVVTTAFAARRTVDVRPAAAAGPPTPHSAAAGLYSPVGGLSAPGSASAFSIGAVVRAAQAQAALVALSSADVIIARHALVGADASRYALGAIAGKVAFWLPQAIGVVLYPRIVRPQSSARAMRGLVLVLAAAGVVSVAGAALLAPLAPRVAGADYRPISDLLWLFATGGALLAVLQGVLLSAIALDRTGLTAVTWLGLVAQVTAVATFGRSVTTLIDTAVLGSATVTVLVFVIVARGTRATIGPLTCDPAYPTAGWGRRSNSRSPAPNRVAATAGSGDHWSAAPVPGP